MTAKDENRGGLWFTNNANDKKPQKLTQHPPPAGSHGGKATDHGGQDPIKQKPGVHESLRKPKG